MSQYATGDEKKLFVILIAIQGFQNSAYNEKKTIILNFLKATQQKYEILCFFSNIRI